MSAIKKRSEETVRDYVKVPTSMMGERCIDELLDLPIDSHCGSVAFHLFEYAAELDSDGDEHWRKAIECARICLHG